MYPSVTIFDCTVDPEPNNQVYPPLAIASQHCYCLLMGPRLNEVARSYTINVAIRSQVVLSFTPDIVYGGMPEMPYEIPLMTIAVMKPYEGEHLYRIIV